MKKTFFRDHLRRILRARGYKTACISQKGADAELVDFDQ
jgi:hypothetical protein